VGERPVAAGVVGALLIAFSAILVKLADVAPSTAAVFRCLYALPLLGWLAWWERRRYGAAVAGDRRLVVIAGVFFAADLILWHYAIRDVGAGLATVLGNLQVVVVPLVAWLVLSERPGARILMAIPLVLTGVALISGVLEAGAYGRDPTRGVIFGALTGVAYAGFILLLRRGNRDDRRPAGPLFDATAVAAVICVPAGFVIGDLDLVPSWPAHAWLVCLALTSQVLGWLLISISLPRLPAALTSLLLCIQPVGSVMLGVVLLGESPSLLQFGGVACIIAGLLVVARRAPDDPEPSPPRAVVAHRAQA
jgi:drug/metabolite transporter (DMT)-like permease